MNPSKRPKWLHFPEPGPNPQNRLDRIQLIVQAASNQLPTSRGALQSLVKKYTTNEPRNQAERVQDIVRAMLATVTDSSAFHTIDDESGTLEVVGDKWLISVYAIRLGPIYFHPSPQMMAYINRQV